MSIGSPLLLVPTTDSFPESGTNCDSGMYRGYDHSFHSRPEASQTKQKSRTVRCFVELRLLLDSDGESDEQPLKVP